MKVGAVSSTIPDPGTPGAATLAPISAMDANNDKNLAADPAPDWLVQYLPIRTFGISQFSLASVEILGVHSLNRRHLRLLIQHSIGFLLPPPVNDIGNTTSVYLMQPASSVGALGHPVSDHI